LEPVTFILKLIVLPLFTLIWVANPWIVGSPAPLTSHSDEGLPVNAFSDVMGFCDCTVKLIKKESKNSETTLQLNSPLENKMPGNLVLTK
jgi:hypothetical protein